MGPGHFLSSNNIPICCPETAPTRLPTTEWMMRSVAFSFRPKIKSFLKEHASIATEEHGR